MAARRLLLVDAGRANHQQTCRDSGNEPAIRIRCDQDIVCNFGFSRAIPRLSEISDIESQ